MIERTSSVQRDPLLRRFGVCCCSGMHEAGVRIAFKFLVGPENLGGPCGEARLRLPASTLDPKLSG
jgi:hypothetical protein